MLIFYQVLEKINPAKNRRDSNQVKGVRFEELIKRYFLTDPTYCHQIKNIYFWEDFPYKIQFPKGGSDTGVDLVVLTNSGQYWAIQCKNWQTSKINKNDVAGFLNTASKYFYDDKNQKTYFKICYFVTATNNISEVAYEQFDNQDFEGAIIDGDTLNQANVDWEQLLQGFSGVSANLVKKKIKPHNYQREIIDKVKKYFLNNDRGKLIMACGTGKTLTSLWIAEEQTNHNGFILFLVPSIALVNQTFEEYIEHAMHNFEYVCVCSDASVVKSDVKNFEDQNLMQIHDLPYPVTTKKDKLKEKLDSFDFSQKGLKVVFSTYQSLDVVIQVQKEFNRPFDLVICDEAHWTAASKDTVNELGKHITDVHDNTKLQAKKRLYMTATPKIYDLNPKQKLKAERDKIELYSMDNEEKFGSEIHRLGFGEAVNKLKVLSDYRVIIFEYNPNNYAEDKIEVDLENDDRAKIQAIYLAINKIDIRQYLSNDSGIGGGEFRRT